MALSAAFVAGAVPGFEALGTKLADAFTAGIQAREARRARNQAALLETAKQAQDFGLRRAQLQFQRDREEKEALLAQRKFLADQTAPVLDVSQGLKGAGGTSGSTGGVGGGTLGAFKLTPGAGQSLEDNHLPRNPLDVAQVGQRIARITQDTRLPETVRAQANDLARRAGRAVQLRDEAAYVALAQEIDALDTLAFGAQGVGQAQGRVGTDTRTALVQRLIAAGETRESAEKMAQDILGQAPSLPAPAADPNVLEELGAGPLGRDRDAAIRRAKGLPPRPVLPPVSGNVPAPALPRGRDRDAATRRATGLPPRPVPPPGPAFGPALPLIPPDLFEDPFAEARAADEAAAAAGARAAGAFSLGRDRDAAAEHRAKVAEDAARIPQELAKRLAHLKKNATSPRVLAFYGDERVPGHPFSGLEQDMAALTGFSIHPDTLAVLWNGTDEQARAELELMRPEERLTVLAGLRLLKGQASNARP